VSLVVFVASPVSIAQEILTNASIVEMVKLGLSPATIVLKIQTSKARFDTSIRELGSLKQSGVSDSIIEAMISTNNPAATAVAEAGPAIEVFLYSVGQRLKLAEAPHLQKMAYGLFGASLKTVIPGRSATSETQDTRPSLEIRSSDPRFEPRKLILSRLEESDEGGGRQLDTEASDPFDVESLEGGAYRIRPKKALKRGEYCIYQMIAPPSVMGGGTLLIYDFRIGPERR
jgi:hypothetical protein